MPASDIKYFICADGKQLGPFTGQQVRTKLFRKTITLDDFAWRDGLGEQWVPIRSLLEELPPDVVPPPAPEIPQLRTIEITHADGAPSTVFEVPEKGIYEPAGTLKQKNLLMKLGCTNPEAIRHIGREQASYVIDRFKEDYAEMYARHLAEEQRARNRVVGITFLVLLCIALVGIGVYWFVNRPAEVKPTPANVFQQTTQRPPIVSQQPTRSVPVVRSPNLMSATPQGEYVMLIRNVEVQHGSKKITLPRGARLPVFSRGSGVVGVRFENESELIPESATTQSK